MITTHQLSDEAFVALASGGGDSNVVSGLRAAQHNEQIVRLDAIADAADDSDPADRGVACFQAAHTLLAQLRTSDPEAFSWLLGLPQLRAWADDCLSHLDQGMPPDFGYLATAAAAAAIRAGIRFELEVPVRDQRVFLPGLGSFQITDQPSWIQLRGDSDVVTVGQHIEARYAALVPDDGSGQLTPQWRGTPLIRAAADGQTWNVLLETNDRYLDRFVRPIGPVLTADEARDWRRHIEQAWQLLVRQHDWAAGPIADSVSVIIATSLPPGPVVLAETLVHELQQLKLRGLMALSPLVERCDQPVYAPWRPDPQPADGLLQGVYAHLGVARFWSAQQNAETEPDDVLRAQVTYERWRRTIEPAVRTLLAASCLTTAGNRFVRLLRDQGRALDAPVPAEAREIAAEVAFDHRLTWQLRHSATDTSTVAALAAGYQRGEPFGGQDLPGERIEEETRKVASTVRSDVLAMRYLEPARYRDLGESGLGESGMPGLSDADTYLVRGKAREAVQAYRDEIAGSSEAQPESWIGLVLSLHRLAPVPTREAFATRLPYIFDVHAQLARRGVLSDPLDLAAWFG